MTFIDGEKPGFTRFLNKFKILDDIPWTEDLIRQSIRQVCHDLDAENIDYTLLRLSINKYMKIGWHKWEAIQYIYSLFNEYMPGRVGLMLSLKYESTKASQRQYAELIDDHRASDYLAGIDLVGDEAEWSKEFYAPIMASWKSARKIVSAHVGESQSIDNIKQAIDIGVTDICHGVKVLSSSELIAYAKESDVYFHMAVTSNYLTGIVPNGVEHPSLLMLRSGLKVTIGTDDPIQCSTTLGNEYNKLYSMGATNEEVRTFKSNAISNITKHGIMIPD